MSEDVKGVIGADVTKFVSAMKAATDSARSFTESTKGALGTLVSPFETLQRTMTTIATIAGGGYVFANIIKSTNAAAKEVGMLTRQFGMNNEAANELRTRIQIAGGSVEDYVGSALRLDRQLRNNESSLRAMGLQTRDSNGRLLEQQQLMDNAAKYLLKFKDGTDRNIEAFRLFGREASGVMFLLKMLGVSGDQAKETMKALGLVVTPDDLRRSREYSYAMSQLGLVFEGIKKAIGDAVLPYLTRFANWFREQGPTIIQSMRTIIASVVGYAFDLVLALGNIALEIMAIFVKVGAGFDNMKTRGAAAGAGAIIGGSLGSLVPGVGTVIGAVGGAAAGWWVGGETKESNDAVEKELNRLATFKERWQATVASFRDMVMTGKGLGEMPSITTPKGGDRSANPEDDKHRKAAMAKIDGEIQDAQKSLERKKQLYSYEVELYRMTTMERLGLVRQATEEEYTEELKLLKQKEKLAAGDLVERQRILNQIKQLSADHRMKMVELDMEAIRYMAQKWNDISQAFQSSFNGQLRGLLAGTTKFKDAFKTILGDMIIYFIQMCQKMVLEWAGMEFAKTFATTTATTTRAGVETAGAATSAAVSKVSTFSKIQQSVAEVFAGVSAFLAPLIGPAAPAAATGVAAGVEAAASGMAMLDTGSWRIPREGVAMLHPGETVLPAGAADVFRRMASGEASGGGSTVLQIQALDGASVERLFMKKGNALMRAINNSLRTGSRVKVPGYAL